MRKFSFILCLIGCTLISFSQKIKINLTCNEEWLCDQDYLRTELKMVEFVRDRFLCDVQVISNIQFTNNGGESNTLTFTGLKSFAGINDTLNFFNTTIDTEEIKRKKMVRYLKLGLIRYIAKSPIADQLNISYDASNESKSDTVKKNDPYNQWQFSLGSSGFFNGDRNSSSQSIGNSLTIGRETEKEKFIFELYNNLQRTKFNFYYKDPETNVDTFEIIKSQQDRQFMWLSYVYKFSEHWAAGLSSNYRRSIVDNFDVNIIVTPRLEYSIYPYKDFNSQRFVFSYELGPQYLNYRDTTIYLKLDELQVKQSISATTSFTKEWGSINLGAEWQNYLADFHKNNLFIGGGISWNIFKGFKFAIGGNFQFIHDQLSIPKFAASKDDLLTQRRILATTYDYFFGTGFSYTFGSIYNSQVNPTFRGLNYSLNF